MQGNAKKNRKICFFKATKGKRITMNEEKKKYTSMKTQVIDSSRFRGEDVLHRYDHYGL